jgi:hypothetical protein
MVKREAKGWVITPQVAVKGMLRDLGKERMTRGVFVHDFYLGILFAYMPWKWLCGFMFKNQVKKHRDELSAKAKKD